ncbi:hypothetical protein E2C01_061673 [Portunus trituberculatus]|uniref:Uncharacterized protein n=1 Tax=Portunus trituberculatus TaxID=210409 RepID=A0A5B7HBV8_PORTR|nr:hypothetical protein [Portunus trituberculatus]
MVQPTRWCLLPLLTPPHKHDGSIDSRRSGQACVARGDKDREYERSASPPMTSRRSHAHTLFLFP